MKVLLLGATGLLGHNVLQQLVDEGHRVVVLVRHADALRLPQGGWETVTGSLLDYDTLSKAAKGCDAVINCAGTTDMSLRRYDDYLPVNRDLCGLLVRLLEEHGINTLVHTSTSNTVGCGTAEKPATEEAPMAPPFKGGYYADSKREGERVILAAATEGRHVVVVNPGFMIGPWDVKPSSGRLLLAAFRKPLMPVPRGGKAFVHVNDVAQAVVRALTAGENGSRYLAVNSLGCLSIKELYRLQAAACGYRQTLVTLPDSLLMLAGKVGDLVRRMGVKTQLSSRNVRQLMVREYYDGSRAQTDLAMPQTSVTDAIKDFYNWRNCNNKT